MGHGAPHGQLLFLRGCRHAHAPGDVVHVLLEVWGEGALLRQELVQNLLLQAEPGTAAERA
eukprot:6174437-Alexandrium_andersonii.AAC.1